MSREQLGVYQVELEVFEGPFDLLLDLILKQEVDIYDVPIAKITEDYLKYLTKMEEFNLEIASEFLVMAATLIELKSAALLPVEEEEFVEATGIIPEEQTRQSLIDHLIEYKLFKNVSSSLATRLEKEIKFYPREAELEEQFAELKPDFLNGVRLDDLLVLAQDLLAFTPSFKVDTNHIAALKMSVAEKIEEMLVVLNKKKRQSFKVLCEGAKNKFEIIVTFLALLELYKQGRVAVSQAVTFGQINVKLLEGSNFKDA